MLVTNGETIHVNWYRNDDFIASVWCRSARSHVVWCQTCLDALPFCSSVLKPDLDLWKLNSILCNDCNSFNLTWTSLSLSVVAIWLLSVKLKYFLAWNSLSSSKSCSLVNAVRLRRDFVDFGPSVDEFSRFSSSSSPVSFSFSEHSESELQSSAKHDIE